MYNLEPDGIHPSLSLRHSVGWSTLDRAELVDHQYTLDGNVLQLDLHGKWIVEPLAQSLSVFVNAQAFLAVVSVHILSWPLLLVMLARA